MNVKRLFLLILGAVSCGMLLGVVLASSGLFAHISTINGLITGGFVSATSLMGFWAYLTLNFIMRGFRFWHALQVIVLAIVCIDVVVLRHDLQGAMDSYAPYLWFAVWPLLIAGIAAGIKAKLAGARAFLPALFFMYVFTIVEWIPGLQLSGQLGMQTMVGIILLGCNSFLLLILGKIIKPSTPVEGKSAVMN
ncbi:KinB-signaling pathway activation protein [Fodinisporobacter ferrooxydans]|uniref:KinB-signaling pathway activation protein n=1 Tax=Fodinisporobacter ferrooxydans TaxID=2901836 RepID=A0ABY4CNM8_9BACL|nr:KinB-signaling pathway activation protein [Alicyclobacillaceae bacterium MYW30-H2]